MQKTGGSNIIYHLKKIFLPSYLYINKHKQVAFSDFDKKNIYLTTIRNPFDLYKSLYQYGCEKKGGLRHSLSKKEQDKFYNKTQDGYNEFINFLLNEKSSQQFGFMTKRFLNINILKEQLNKIKKIGSYEELNNFYLNNKIFTHIIKNELLEEDFKKFIMECQNKFKNIYLVENPLLKLNLLFKKKINISKPLAIRNELLPFWIKEQVLKKERLIFENFYPNELLNINNFSKW
jgi:hypothetical protein